MRQSAIAAAGIVLSQPTRHTTPSIRWPRTTRSIESAITSRLTSDARIPSVPIDTPSETEIVLNSIGVPPAARMPSLTRWARSRWLKLHGMVSIHVVDTPTSGRARSSSVNPIPFSIARAAARSGPSVMAALCRLAGSDGRSYGLLNRVHHLEPPRGSGGEQLVGVDLVRVADHVLLGVVTRRTDHHPAHHDAGRPRQVVASLARCLGLLGRRSLRIALSHRPRVY